jgi:hypothetical protein
MSKLEGFAVLSDSYKDPETFKFISETCKERYGQYKKAHHVWLNEVEPGKFRDSLESVRQNQAILGAIEQKFPGSTIQSVTESDEVYWSASPKEALGSDRSLVDCHYDAPFAVIPTGGVIYYRVIIAMNENNTVTTVFPDEDKKVKMNTGDFHGLDYNKDWHCVEGSIPADKYRVLLKLHYVVVPKDTHQMWIDWVRFINVSWTHLSRATMRMSADPKTPFEIFIGIVVNVCRFVFNNINTIAIYLGILFLVIFAIFVIFPKGRRKNRLFGNL